LTKKDNSPNKGFGKVKKTTDFKRKKEFKTPASILTIVCEGKKTEPIYFEDIRKLYKLSTLRLSIIPNQGAPISIVNRALKEKKHSSKDDSIWCVFDVEVLSKNPSFSRAVKLARTNNINLAISNPSFEFWFLLHFEKTDRPFSNADEIIEYLKNYMPEYDKGKSVFNELENNTKLAVSNVSNIRNNSVDKWTNFPNPSTSVDILVTEILSLISEQSTRL
jgi:hypothetical protein